MIFCGFLRVLCKHAIFCENLLPPNEITNERMKSALNKGVFFLLSIEGFRARAEGAAISFVFTGLQTLFCAAE